MSDILDGVKPVRIARSARRHKIGNAHILTAMQDAGEPVALDDDALLYVGRDGRGIELEIVAVPDDRNPHGITVIHAMPTDFKRRSR